VEMCAVTRRNVGSARRTVNLPDVFGPPYSSFPLQLNDPG
jgi:hypothetical protein